LQEKELSRLVVTAFKQGVCGFDLLRSDKVGAQRHAWAAVH
jgi:hypothetical protein